MWMHKSHDNVGVYSFFIIIIIIIILFIFFGVTIGSLSSCDF